MTIKLSLLLSYRHIEINFTRHVISTEELLQVARALDLRDRGCTQLRAAALHEALFWSRDFTILYLPHYAKSCEQLSHTHTHTHAHTHIGAVRTLHSLRRTSSRPIFNERIICISVARSGWCPVVDIREKDNWFGSAISFARSPRYVSRYASSSVVRWRRDGDSTSRFNIREKRAGRLLTDDRYATPSGVFILVFPSAYLFCKLSRRSSTCVVPLYIITGRKRKRMTRSLRCAAARTGIEFIFCSISFCCYINCCLFSLLFLWLIHK